MLCWSRPWGMGLTISWMILMPFKLRRRKWQRQQRRQPQVKPLGWNVCALPALLAAPPALPALPALPAAKHLVGKPFALCMYLRLSASCSSSRWGPRKLLPPGSQPARQRAAPPLPALPGEGQRRRCNLQLRFVIASGLQACRWPTVQPASLIFL